MKKITPSVVLWLGALALLLAACGEPKTAETEADTAPEREERALDETTAQIDQPDEISVDLARTMLQHFDSIVTNDPGKQFAHGFKLNYGDIQALYHDRDVTNEDTIYTMIGYKAADSTFELVFCIETPTNSGEYKYYDFTQSCPNYCPPDLAPGPVPSVSDLGGAKGYWFGREGMDEILGTSEGANVTTYLMLRSGSPSSGVDYRVCLVEGCTNEAYFARCGTATGPACHDIP